MSEIVIAIVQSRLSDQIPEIVAELWLVLMTPLKTLQGSRCYAILSCLMLKRAPGTGDTGGLQSLGSHGVRHD